MRTIATSIVMSTYLVRYTDASHAADYLVKASGDHSVSSRAADGFTMKSISLNHTSYFSDALWEQTQ
jgi:hypothetical protein